jgi:mutator protein MutT
MTAGESSSSAPPLEIAIGVVEHAGRFLIGLRPAGVPLAGYWEFPGGKIESGESAQPAAVRECLEETGLAVRVVGEYPSALHRYDHGDVRLRFFACQVVDMPRALPERFRWIARAELNSYQFPPANAGLMQLLSAADRA